MKRSLHMFYSHNVTSKRKYEGMRVAMRVAGKVTYNGIPIPNLVLYQKLMAHINDLEIGTVLDINPTYTTEMGSKTAV